MDGYDERHHENGDCQSGDDPIISISVLLRGEMHTDVNKAINRLY